MALQASVRCLGNWGKLLEIGKYDILNHTNLDMRPMLNNVSFEGIDVDRVMNHPESTEVSPFHNQWKCLGRSQAFCYVDFSILIGRMLETPRMTICGKLHSS